jgi:hypothetical protein
MHPRTAAFLSIVALAGAGCMASAAHSTPPPTNVVEGRARQIGGPGPGRRVVGLVRTDAHGRFSLRLPPGTYRVELDGGQHLQPGRVTVEAVGTTHLSLTQSVK